MSPTARPFLLATRVDLCQHRSHRHLLPARTPQVRLRESADNRLSVPRENRDSSRAKRYSRSPDIGLASTSAQHQPNTNPTSALIHRRPHESSQPADRQLCTAVDCGGPPRAHLQSPVQRFDSARRLFSIPAPQGRFLRRRADRVSDSMARKWRGLHRCPFSQGAHGDAPRRRTTRPAAARMCPMECPAGQCEE